MPTSLKIANYTLQALQNYRQFSRNTKAVGRSLERWGVIQVC